MYSCIRLSLIRLFSMKKWSFFIGKRTATVIYGEEIAELWNRTANVWKRTANVWKRSKEPLIVVRKEKIALAIADSRFVSWRDSHRTQYTNYYRGRGPRCSASGASRVHARKRSPQPQRYICICPPARTSDSVRIVIPATRSARRAWSLAGTDSSASGTCGPAPASRASLRELSRRRQRAKAASRRLWPRGHSAAHSSLPAMPRSRRRCCLPLLIVWRRKRL